MVTGPEAEPEAGGQALRTVAARPSRGSGGKNAPKWTRLSCRRFRDNQVRLQRFALAYTLGNFLRQLALPREVKHWSLTTLRERPSRSVRSVAQLRLI